MQCNINESFHISLISILHLEYFAFSILYNMLILIYPFVYIIYISNSTIRIQTAVLKYLGSLIRLLWQLVFTISSWENCAHYTLKVDSPLNSLNIVNNNKHVGSVIGTTLHFSSSLLRSFFKNNTYVLFD